MRYSIPGLFSPAETRAILEYTPLICCKFYISKSAGFSDVGDNEGYDDEDGCESVISSAASSRVSTAKTRASSAQLSHSRRGSGPVGSSKPLSSVPHKKSNAWTSQTDAEKQEKQSPLVLSLFAHLPPTIYFFLEEERGIDLYVC